MNTRLIQSPFQSQEGPPARELAPARFSPGEERVATATAIEALSWARTKFEDRCCVLSSMQDTTVIDLAMQVDRDFPIVFLDTGYHFVETWDTLRAVERRYGITVDVVAPLTPPVADPAPGACCDDKSKQLAVALQDRDAWVSGIRRSQTEVRAAASLIDRDSAGRTKINPLAQWSDHDIARFIQARGLLRNPLLDRGYSSIGCEPCTSPPVDVKDARSGRWAGTERTECGLHL